MKRFFLAASIAALMMGAGQSAGAQTLAETLATAYQTNPSLAAERARLRQTDEGFFQARAQRLPSLSAGAGYSDTLDSWGGNAGLGGDDGSVSYSVTASQSLYSGGRISGGIDQAVARIQASRESLRASEQQTLLQAIQAHVDVRRDSEVVRIRTNNVEVLNRQLQAARDRFEVGEITRTDVAQAEARVSGAQAQLSGAQAQLAASRAFYERVVGIAPQNLEAPGDTPALPQNYDGVVEVALDRNPNLRAAQYGEAAAEHSVRVARGARLPDVSLQASASERRESDFSGRGVGSTSIQARVSIPLFTGGANESRIRQAIAGVDEARLLLASARRQVIEGITNAWNQYLTAQAVIESSREAVRANEIAFEGVEQEAFVGLRTTLDVLNAEQELLNSRLDYVSAERDMQVASYALLVAMGALDFNTLGLDVETIDVQSRIDNAQHNSLDLTPWN
ncbi:TolC family outer membrane protein [Woodsholea maritima]|uniref:TolC family outer membrane protein n=1 Tax=Woodsholea maritima TaxID=240237 RepID=UPI00037F9F28|nr:TolC family outer membrane protein [Woodsholea maritima]